MGAGSLVEVVAGRARDVEDEGALSVDVGMTMAWA
jgi:hypothetical protein